jgi:hypothetical protein
MQRTHPVEQGPEVGRSGRLERRWQQRRSSMPGRRRSRISPAGEATGAADPEVAVKRDARAARGARENAAEAARRSGWQHLSRSGRRLEHASADSHPTEAVELRRRSGWRAARRAAGQPVGRTSRGDPRTAHLHAAGRGHGRMRRCRRPAKARSGPVRKPGDRRMDGSARRWMRAVTARG